MCALLGVVCLFAKVNCTPPVLWGKPYESKDKCEAIKGQMDNNIKPVEWLYGEFKCVEDSTI